MLNVKHTLIEIVQRHSKDNCAVQTAMPSVALFKASKPSQCDASIYKPSLVITLQGTKILNLFTQSQSLSEGHCLISSIDIPVLSRIALACEDKPYLSIVFELDINLVAELITELEEERTPNPHAQAVTITPVSSLLMDAVSRVICLLDNPRDIPIIFPLLQREIIYRLLLSEQGGRLRHLCTLDSSSYKVSKAIKYLNQHFDKPIKIEALAQLVSMSVSSLHQHFKAITAMTPLQFQKQLRLHQARNHILQHGDVSAAAYLVGYESASQFSREYSRLFGLPPSQDRLSMLN